MMITIETMTMRNTNSIIIISGQRLALSTETEIAQALPTVVIVITTLLRTEEKSIKVLEIDPGYTVMQKISGTLIVLIVLAISRRGDLKKNQVLTVQNKAM